MGDDEALSAMVEEKGAMIDEMLSDEVQMASNGVPTSQHLTGEAIDMKPYGSTTYNQLLEYIHKYSDNIHVFDQLILYPAFIHISFGFRDRRQVIDKRK